MGLQHKAYRDQFPFLVGGSDEDPFEHRQVDLARERLGKFGLRIERLPGGHLTTNERPVVLAALDLFLPCVHSGLSQLRGSVQVAKSSVSGWSREGGNATCRTAAPGASGFHSYRSTTTGSTFVARRAGM
jgi:hypothetical protein